MYVSTTLHAVCIGSCFNRHGVLSQYILQSLPLSLVIWVGNAACTAVILMLCRRFGVHQQHTQLYQVTASSINLPIVI